MVRKLVMSMNTLVAATAWKWTTNMTKSVLSPTKYLLLDGGITVDDRALLVNTRGFVIVVGVLFSSSKVTKT
jgi:hypothetical protein